MKFCSAPKSQIEHDVNVNNGPVSERKDVWKRDTRREKTVSLTVAFELLAHHRF